MASTLDGITVLDFGSGMAAALATMFMSDHGARVIRVIDKDDAVLRDGGFVIWDRGKECVAMDLSAAAKNPDAATEYRKLIAGADVVLEDFAPSSDRQALVDWRWLSRINPRLITCSVTAYGKIGPLKDEPPIDDLVLARMGVLGGMPGFRPAPVHVAHELPSVGAAIFANLGVAAALLGRETTGRGRTVETSMMAGALLFHPKVVGENVTRHVFQTDPTGSAPFYSLYECADGEWIQLGCVHVGFMGIAANLMGIGDLVAQPRFDGGRGGAPEDEAALRATLREVMKTKPSAEWAEAFEAADVPFAQCRQTEDGMADPQIAHNEMLVTLEDPALGPVMQMGVPIKFSETPGEVRGPRAATASATTSLNALNPSPASQGDPARQNSPETGAADQLDPPPLDGIRVLEITNLIAGPTGGRLLADLGADVIKFEPPTGDLSRPIGRNYFYNINFNKRSVSVNASKDEGKKVAQRIAASADALLANLRPHATERMGIGAAINPTLIETHLTGYGWTGPYSHRPGIDPLAQSLMGMSRAQGGPGNPPVFTAQLAPTDFTTGAMGALGTVLALFARKRTGVVQRVDCNLLNGAVVLSSAWFSKYAGKPDRPLADKDQYGISPYHRLYQLSDGWVYVVARDASERAALCKVAGIDDDTTETTGHPNETPFAQAMTAAFATRSLDETLKALTLAGVPRAEAQAGDSELFLNDPHTVANDLVATRQHPTAGKIRVAWRYIQFGGTAPTAGLPTPLLGEHSDEVLRDIGYSDAEIQKLHDDGIVITETV